VDDWNYTYIDHVGLKRFLVKMGHVPSRAEIFAIIRRIDMDGDCKLKKEEFSEGIKSQFAIVNSYGSKVPN
jgi:Ca2+-binding EF-hand superfamily protein